MQYLVFIIGWKVRPTTILFNRAQPWLKVVNPTIEPGFFQTENGWVFGMVYHVADQSPKNLNPFPKALTGSFLEELVSAYLTVPEDVRNQFLSDCPTDPKQSWHYVTVVSDQWLSAHVQPSIETMRYEEINGDLLQLVAMSLPLEAAIHA